MTVFISEFGIGWSLVRGSSVRGRNWTWIFSGMEEYGHGFLVDRSIGWIGTDLFFRVVSGVDSRNLLGSGREGYSRTVKAATWICRGT